MATIRGTSKKNKLVGTMQDDTILGLGGNDTIDGRGGNDTIKGGGGNDKITGGAGVDSLDGGNGSDTYTFKAADVEAGEEITDTGTTGTDTLRLANENDVNFGLAGKIEGIEKLAFGTSGFSGLTAFFQASQFGAGKISSTLAVVTANVFDEIWVNEANDFDASGFTFTGAGATTAFMTILDTNGNDVIKGSSLNDTIQTGGGQDTLDGGEGADTYNIATTSPAAGLKIADSGTNPADQDMIRLYGGVAVDLTGVGEMSGIEILDIFVAKGAIVNADQLSSTTEIRESFSADTLTINKASNFSGAGWTFVEWEAQDSVVINGTAKDDSIEGTTERDTISGGTGIDTLAGGGSADTFTFVNGDSGTGSGSRDQILDFKQGVDLIDVSSFGADFIDGKAFSGGATPEIRFEDDGTSTIIQIDSDGNGTVDQEIELNKALITLTKDDFLL